MAESTNYTQLIQKLDAFIRKYYVNQLIKGSLITLGLLGVVFLVFSLSESFFYFGRYGRKALFYSFLGLSAFSLVRWVALPLLHYFKLGAIISHDKAAAIIGAHFPTVSDKLLNILQLHRQWEQHPDTGLLLAGIEQKTEALRPIPFPAAIDLSHNRRYLRYALPPLVIMLGLLVAAPSLIREPATRIIANNRDFERPAPFQFMLEDKQLQAIQFSDYELKVTTEGNVHPNEIFISIGEYQYRLKKEDHNLFTYTFTNVAQAVNFRLFSGPVSSREYTLDVLAKPSVTFFEVKADYPDYTGRSDETITNIGDLVVPIGTRLTWVFNTLHTDVLMLQFGEQESEVETKRQGKSDYVFSKRATRDESYLLLLGNKNLPRADSIRYFLTVVPDLHPSIRVESFIDSLEQAYVFFAGDAQDDYGISQLTFNYRIVRANGMEENLISQPIPIKREKTIAFDYAFDIQQIGLRAGDEVTYYFEVWDNDAINGRKTARSHVMRFAKPSAEEYAAMERLNNEEIKDKLLKSLEESKKIQQDIDKLSQKLLQEKNLDWQQRKELEKLLDRRKELQNEVEKAKDMFDQNLRNQNEFSQPREELRQKQEMLQKMFDEMLSEEMKEMIRELEELLQEMQKEEALEKLESMKLDEEELSKELDRMMEMFKKLEVEKDIQDQIEKLQELAKEQENLAEKTENQDLSGEELQQKQEELNEKFGEMQEKMQDILDRNKDLESPLQLGDPEQQMEEIQEDMNDAGDQLKQQDNKKASKAQKGASQKMKDMAKSMEMNMEMGEQEQMEEDLKALRQLLENLITLSFAQEDLIADVNKTSEAAPRYVQLVQVQKKLQDDFKLVEDSLQALSKRVIQIESFVTEKVTEIKGNMRRSVHDLEDRKKAQAVVDQQFSMKNLNDLALMLSESMEQMQQDMAGNMAGSQNCKKPGGKSSGGAKPSDKMGKGQESINQIMKDLQERLKKGQGGSSKEFAQLAARQAAMRKALEELAKEKRQSGKPDKDLQDIIDQMDKTETELVNKRLTAESMKRQEQILKKLLEFEKAEREREQDEKRQAETAQQYERRMPPALEEYLRKRQAELDLYRTVSPELKPYYKHLVEEYHRNLKIGR